MDNLNSIIPKMFFLIFFFERVLKYSKEFVTHSLKQPNKKLNRK